MSGSFYVFCGPVGVEPERAEEALVASSGAERAEGRGAQRNAQHFRVDPHRALLIRGGRTRKGRAFLHWWD